MSTLATIPLQVAVRGAENAGRAVCLVEYTIRAKFVRVGLACHNVSDKSNLKFRNTVVLYAAALAAGSEQIYQLLG